MICPNCGKRYDGTRASFCGKCGTALSAENETQQRTSQEAFGGTSATRERATPGPKTGIKSAFDEAKDSRQEQKGQTNGTGQAGEPLKDDTFAFASGLPRWSLTPPGMPVMRKKAGA